MSTAGYGARPTEPTEAPAVRDMTIVADPTHRRHDPPYDLDAGQRRAPRHERAERVDRIEQHLHELGWLITDAVPSGNDPLTAVHDPDLVRFLRDGYDAWRRAGGAEVMIPDTHPSPRWARGGRRSRSPIAELGWWCFDTATPLVEGSYAAARAAVDVAVTAADAVASGTALAYALVRPPGHHAGPDYLGGFCLFNPAAVAARRLSEGGRVAVLDVDVHHGNGTQDVFWRDPQVAYVSLHADPDHQFPFYSGFADEVGEGPGRGSTHNLPLAPGSGDDTYLAALEQAAEVVDAFDPTVLVVSAGLDLAADDPVGQLAVSDDGLEAVGRTIAALDRPTLVVQEGGYAVDRLAGQVTRFLDGVRTG